MDTERLLTRLICIIAIISLHSKYAVCKGAGQQCIVNDSQGCTCNFTDGSGVVDLRGLGNSDNTPRFKHVKGADGRLYAYNPCFGFNEGACNNASVCLFENGSQTQIGNAGSGRFEFVENYGVVAVYTIQPYGKVSMVQLTCDPKATEPTFKAFGELSTEGFYVFQLMSKCACPGMCTDIGPTFNITV